MQREAMELLGEDPRIWSTDTLGFIAGAGDGVTAVQVQSIPVPRDTREIPAELVLIAKGFTGPEQTVLDAFAGYDNVHLAGDARMGSTLVATAMADALQVADEIARKLQGD